MTIWIVDISHRNSANKCLRVRIYCQGVELPSSPISLHVLSPEESRAASRAAISTSRDDIVAETRASAPQNSDSNGVLLQKSDSGSDVDISHKSFAQRRLHIIKQLETQNGSVKKKTTTQKTQASHEQLPKAGKNNEKTVLFENSTHQEMAQRPPDIGLVSFSGLTEPCSVGSIVEVVINAHGDCAAGSVQVDAVSPNGRPQPCAVTKRANSYTASFTPQQVGECNQRRGEIVYSFLLAEPSVFESLQ
ncbi:unnamed protein product [Cylicostephanus goldi]|uniref:Uncharacterized protein n=1 Tax=Cylicostephanus goldi TaxID=71465 RepID=A0A3P7MLR8_CYLGO|nr:unnamed protein product [Cylicostephanus goldi]